VLVALLAGAPAASAARPGLARTVVRGDIVELGVARIAVGRVTCRVTPKLAPSAGRFVIGDPVRMTCLNGVLASVRYSPPPDPSRSVVVPASSPRAASTRPAGDVATSYFLKWSFVTLTPAGTTTSPQAKTSAAGTIAELSADGITVGGLSCRIHPLLSSTLGRVAHVGDRVSIACATDSGLLTSISSSR
jgi:hypothetical protein